MKGLRNQAKKHPGLEFCDFRLKTRAKSLILLKNQLLIRISEILKKQNSNEKLIFEKNDLLARLSPLKKTLRTKMLKVKREARFSSKMSLSFEFCFF